MAFISETLLGVILGGIIAFVSSILVNLIQDYIKRPILLISDIITFWGMAEEGGESLWTAARITVKNQGGTAAEDCKATLIDLHDDPPIEMRVGWLIPKGDFTVTINADDTESIDLCAINPKGVLLITTSESGYGKGKIGEVGSTYPRQITGQLKVSASNAKQCVKKIWISTVLDRKAKFVYFSKPEDWPPKSVS